MTWSPMSIDEFASYKKADGIGVAKVGGIWWAEVRPCFYRPLVPFQELKPWSRLYPPKAALGGFVHLVPSQIRSSACLNFHVYDDLKNYSLGGLSTNRRKFIRRGMRRFTDGPVASLEEFVEQGHPIYRSFYERTNYWYKCERTDKQAFHRWAKALYDYPKIDKTGVYLDGRLCAVITSFQIDDIIFGDNLFTDQGSLRLNVVDYVMHRMRERAAETDARFFFSGLPTGKETLDSSKLMRGCKLLRLPAYCKINPLALAWAKNFMKDSYHKLLTVMAQPHQEVGATGAPGMGWEER